MLTMVRATSRVTFSTTAAALTFGSPHVNAACRVRGGHRRRAAIASRVPMAIRSLVLAACATLLACAGGPRPAAGSAPADVVRVLVYNIHAGKDASGADNLERVSRLVRELGVDVALLQEVDRGTRRSDGTDQPAELSRLSGLNAVFGRTLDYQGGGYGIALLSRFPVRADTLVHLPVDPPQERAGGSHEPRGAQIVSVVTPSGPLHLLNTHLDASGSDDYRLQEARQVVSLLDSLRGTGAPVLAGGDFNAPPGTEVIRRVAASGLRDGWLACGGAGDGLTYPAAAPVKRIDFLFLSPGVECRSAEIVGDEISDHRGVLFELVLGASHR
jgi:endonuclease/exonuclease/phosphatase family metal-dependent hydrolase